jgi:cytochrome P450
VQTTPVVDSRAPLTFDPFAPGFDANPHAVLRALREADPVHWWAGGRAWLVTRYDDVEACLRDRRLSTDYRDWEHAAPRKAGEPPTALQRLMDGGLFSMPEADHVRVRRLVSPTFTPRGVEKLRAATQQIVDDALAAAGARPGEPFDVARDFAERVPLRVIGTMVGVQERDEASFRRFASAVVEAVNSPWLSHEQMQERLAVLPEGVAMLEGLIEERRRRPTDDLLSGLVAAEEAGDRLSNAELISLVAVLIVAGSETTVHLIDFGVLTLLRHPEQLRLVLDDPALLKNAIEEILRYDLFGKVGLMRFAREDFALRDRPIRKGQMVAVSITSALRDPAAFPEPDRFDVRRDNAASIAFGVGAHHCLGAWLARLEGQVALSTLLTRFPHMRLAGEPTFGRHASVRKMETLPVYV